MDFSSAHRDVLVLVGTQTGNSELIAAAVADRLAGLGFTCHVVDMADAYPEMLADYAQLVAVTCTWADGTFPDNAKDFAAALDGLDPGSGPGQALDLSGLAFGVVGLGDRDYDPYYLTAAERLEALLTERGAARLVPMLRIDGIPAASDYEAARAWALALAEAFAAQSPA